MSGFEVEDGRLVFTYGNRRVATTGGTLLQFLTDEATFTANLAWPDAVKTELYTWQYTVELFSGNRYSFSCDAWSVVGARAQEWNNTIVLGAAPAGADMFLGRVQLTRTNDPSHTWLGQPISPFFTEGAQIPLRGSMLVEGAIGITRSMTLDVQGSNLVAIIEQSVGPVAGNFGTQGYVPVASPPNSTDDDTRKGYETVCAIGSAGLPIWWQTGSPYRKAYDDGVEATNPGSTASYINQLTNMRYGGSQAAVYSDPTDYASTYALTVRGRFGRRS